MFVVGFSNFEKLLENNVIYRIDKEKVWSHASLRIANNASVVFLVIWATKMIIILLFTSAKLFFVLTGDFHVEVDSYSPKKEMCVFRSLQRRVRPAIRVKK